jgi:hypothetical protein
LPGISYSVVRAIAAILIVLVALRWPKLGSSILRTAETQLYRFAKRGWLAVLVIASVAILGNVTIALATRIPQPWVADEFSHLLAADTFSSGRLSNPTHPMWIHFESFHINQKPTYVSKYPPAQGLILALGQIVSGQPIIGVWLSAGLACGALCWMLQGWFRPGIALVGALLAVFRIGVTTYWSQSYWGGMMAALGGALVFGALPRVLSRPRVVPSVVLGIGLAILANSRPYEGLLASIPVFVVLGHRCLRSPTQEQVLPLLRRVVVPVCSIGLLTLLAMGYYNFRQTGNAFVTAYQVYADTYQMQPIFAWERFREPPVYHQPILRQVFTRGASNSAQYEQLVQAVAPKLRDHLLNFWTFYCGVAFTLPLLMAMVAMRSFVWCALASVAAVSGGLMLGSLWIFPHYAAPMTGPLFIVLTYGWSRLRAFRFRRRRTGLFVARIIVALCATLLVVRIAAVCLGLKPETRHGSLVALLTYTLSAQSTVPGWPYQRAATENQLEQSGGAHLILVRYAQNHNLASEWVYNKADIDRAPVVWAREMSPAQNRQLIDYFHSRHVWLLEADQPAPKLVPYPPLVSDVATSSYDSGRKP